MKKQLWLLLALVIGVTMWAAPALAAEPGETYLPLCYGRNTVMCAADETNFYWTDSENVWQAPRQGGDKTRLYAAKGIKYLSCANGSLYFIAEGSLIKYDLATGESKKLSEWVTKPAVYQGSVYYLKCISEWHTQLCRQPMQGGTEEMLADHVSCYWFSEGRVCYTEGSSFDLAGEYLYGNAAYSLPLAGGAAAAGYYTYASDWADGWYYCKDVVSTGDYYGRGKLYRWRWQNGQREFEKILLLQDMSRLDIVQVVDGTVYYTMQTYSEYTPGRFGTATSPLYAYDIEADGLPRRLTDCKVSDFYVFGEQVVYKEARWYDGTWPEWQVLDLTK